MLRLRIPDRRLAVVLAILLMMPYLAQAQAAPSLKDILEKNVKASGGREKIARVQNLAFKIGPARYVSASTGQLKILTGKDPVVTDVILVAKDKVQRKSYNNISELTGIPKAVYETMAQLYAGLFSLQQFSGQLKFEGPKNFGPEKLFELSTTVDPLKVRFFLRADDFFLKRIVFQGVTPEREKYEVNYDFALFEQAESCLIPLSWFISQVGTRGNLSELTEVRVNQTLESDFFAKLEVNVGTVTVAPGSLKGNMLDFNTPPNTLSIVTNWTKKDVEQAGLKTNDLLALTIEGVESELVFYAAANELPPQNVLSQGARILAPAQRGGETFVIQFIATDTTQIAPKLKVLAPIEVKKK
jgi:hypothetical protein